MKTIVVVTEADERYVFGAKPFLGRQLLAVNAALAKRAELMDRSAQATVEMAGFCRALEIVKACCERFSGPHGDVAACEENLVDIPPSVVMQAALEMQGVRARLASDEASSLGN